MAPRRAPTRPPLLCLALLLQVHQPPRHLHLRLSSRLRVLDCVLKVRLILEQLRELERGQHSNVHSRLRADGRVSARVKVKGRLEVEVEGEGGISGRPPLRPQLSAHPFFAHPLFTQPCAQPCAQPFADPFSPPLRPPLIPSHPSPHPSPLLEAKEASFSEEIAAAQEGDSDHTRLVDEHGDVAVEYDVHARGDRAAVANPLALRIGVGWSLRVGVGLIGVALALDLEAEPQPEPQPKPTGNLWVDVVVHGVHEETDELWLES